LKLSSLIGLNKEKQLARIQISACMCVNEIFPHTLLTGVGGTGKTAFARAIGDELGYHFIETHAAVFKKKDQLFPAIISHSEESKRLGKRLLFFIDEIHRLRLDFQECLYSPMKEWWIPTASGRHKVNPFSLFGATTRFDMLDSNSFITRFGNVWEIDRYSEVTLAIIIARELSRNKINFSDEVPQNIAKRCLGIPRTAVNFSQKLRNLLLSKNKKIADGSDVDQMFDLEEIDAVGLTKVHHNYLRILYSSRVDNHFIPLGVNVLASKMRQSEDVVKGSIEPILLELDLVASTSRGRVLTSSGSRHVLSYDCK